GIGLLVETAFNVMMPLALKYLVDEVFEEGDRSQLIWILAVLGIAGLITSIVAIWYEWQDAKVSSAITADVRKSLFDHIQTLPHSFYARTKRGEVLSRFSNDMVTFEESVVHFANWGVLPALELMAGLVLLLVLNWQLGLVACLIFPLLLIGPRLLTPKAVVASYELKRSQAGELAVVQENIGAQTVVKAFSLQKISRGWFFARNDALRRGQQHSTFLNTMVERSITIGVLWLHLIVLAIGAYLTFEGHISVGTFVAFESVFWEITYNLTHVTQYIPVAINASGSVRHMKDLLEEPQVITDKPDAHALPPIQNEIRFDNVSFSYGGDERQLRNFSHVIPAGKRVAIVGPSGAGKSTMMSLVLRLHDPVAGSVTIDGHDLRDVTRDSLLSQIAVVFQDNVLFNVSLRENIRLGNPDATDAEIEAAAKQAEIDKFIRSLPQGYDTIVGERGDTLSGGQRQRIAIARALVRQPKILLLDEATSALDQSTEASINRTLKKIGKGRTVLFITHRLTSVVDMDEIIVLERGKLVERGTHAELMASGKLYKKLWRDQMREHDEDED
ncbi:MAG: ABC transporter ATP-binding protein, partial [Beijerinckiaceae bacterium]